MGENKNQVLEEIKLICTNTKQEDGSLPKVLCINQIEYARKILYAFVAQTPVNKTAIELFVKGDIALQNDIKELGGVPNCYYKN